MQFSVVPMRHRGRSVDHHTLANRAPVVGDLRIEEVRDEVLGRYVRTARVLDPTHPKAPDLLPTLRDPVMIAMSPLAFSLSGLEQIGDQDYAQSWLVKPAR